jgi:hypothetical protein
LGLLAGAVGACFAGGAIGGIFVDGTIAVVVDVIAFFFGIGEGLVFACTPRGLWVEASLESGFAFALAFVATLIGLAAGGDGIARFA